MTSLKSTNGASPSPNPSPPGISGTLKLGSTAYVAGVIGPLLSGPEEPEPVDGTEDCPDDGPSLGCTEVGLGMELSSLTGTTSTGWIKSISSGKSS